jgi:hypothetical protein
LASFARFIYGCYTIGVADGAAAYEQKQTPQVLAFFFNGFLA